MSKELLTPLQLVEVGHRISERTIDGLGLIDLIEDARLVVRRGLKGLTAVGATIGVGSADLEQMALGTYLYVTMRWAKTSLRRMPHSYDLNPFGAPGTVLTGEKKRAGSRRRYAFVFRKGAAILLGDNAKYAHGSLSALAQAADYHGPGRRYWEELGRYEPGSRLRS